MRATFLKSAKEIAFLMCWLAISKLAKQKGQFWLQKLVRRMLGTNMLRDYVDDSGNSGGIVRVMRVGLKDIFGNGDGNSGVKGNRSELMTNLTLGSDDLEFLASGGNEKEIKRFFGG